MPTCTVFLLALASSIPQFLTALQRTPLNPITIAKAIRWIVRPTELSRKTLLSEPFDWDLLLILPGAADKLPQTLDHLVRKSWRIQAGIPSRILNAYSETNTRLLRPQHGDVPPLETPTRDLRLAESTQDLELTGELNDWIQSNHGPQGAISMLNLLAFHPGKKEEYMSYGKAFSESVGSRRGGIAKLVGKIIPDSCSDGCDEWEEVMTCS